MPKRFKGHVFVTNDESVYMLVENFKDVAHYNFINVTTGILVDVKVPFGSDLVAIRQELESKQEVEVVQEFDKLFEVQMELPMNTNVVKFKVNGSTITTHVEAVPSSTPDDIKERAIEVLKEQGIDLSDKEYDWEVGV